MKLYMIRHGETTLNKKKVYYGSTDCPLTETGEVQARSLRPFFEPMALDAVWVSPLKRAADTAALALGENGAPRETDRRLAEVAFGGWEGKTWRELKDDALFQRWCDDWRFTVPPGGESFDDLARRVRRFYEERVLAFEGERALVVAHHAVLRQLMVCLLDAAPEAFWRFSFGQGTYSVCDINDGYAVLTGHNLRPLGGEAL